MTLTVEDHAPAWLVALHAGAPSAAQAMLRDNLAGMLTGWRDFPDAMDFLSPTSPNAAWKGLMTRLYLEQIRELLGGLPTGRVLDLACGVGRLALPLLEAGCEVHGIDATLPSLRAAATHLRDHSDRTRLLWGDVTDANALAALAPPYDAAVALELLCYLPDPARALAAWLPLLRPGAPLVLSVEAWPGALLADPIGLQQTGVREALRSHRLQEDGVRQVQTYTADALSSLLRGSGFEGVRIQGTHYVLDGPLVGLANPDLLHGPDAGAHGEALLGLERLLRTEAGGDLPPRAWIAVAEAPRRGATLGERPQARLS